MGTEQDRFSHDPKENQEASEYINYKSEFMPLDDLVYSSVEPLAESNHRLRMHILDEIKASSDIEHRLGQEICHIKNINIAYDRTHVDEDGSSRVECMELKLPVLSVVPLTNLTVEKGNIQFHAEIGYDLDDQNKPRLCGKISSPKERVNASFARIFYQIEVQSVPAAEGIMRLTDLLESQPIAREMAFQSVDAQGRPCSEEYNQLQVQIRALKARIRKLQTLYDKVNDLSAQQERLSQLSQGQSYRDTHQEEFAFAQDAQARLLEKIIQLQQELLRLEMESEQTGDWNAP